MGLREYNAELDQMEREAKAGDGLTRSLSVVAEKNPDEEARARELSSRTGIPADWIPEFKDEVTAKKLPKAVAKVVAGRLGNTAGVAQKSYMDPGLFPKEEGK